MFRAGRIQSPETCRLSEVIGAAVETQAPAAEQSRVEIRTGGGFVDRTAGGAGPHGARVSELDRQCD